MRQTAVVKEKPPPLDRASLEGIVDNLRDQRGLSIAGGHKADHRDGANGRVRIALIVAHTAHIHRLGAAVRLLIDQGLTFESVALVREAYETAITVSWVAHNPIAAQAFVNDYVNKRRVLRDEFASSASSAQRRARVLIRGRPSLLVVDSGAVRM